MSDGNEYQEIREKLAGQGMELTDQEYREQLAYARRKAECAGKDESYIPYLLPDVIKDYFTRQVINSIYFAMRGDLYKTPQPNL